MGNSEGVLMVGGFVQGTSGQSAPTGKRMLWSIEYYARYFDVDTKQVLDRCWAAIFPRTPFLDVLGGNPDLYGIYPSPSTIVLFLLISSISPSVSAIIPLFPVSGFPCALLLTGD
jgi:hypothetical protein